ncbi:MAG: serine hydrolase [Patescibacteria group bacterium]|jgi:beta-lactamase class A
MNKDLSTLREDQSTVSKRIILIWIILFLFGIIVGYFSRLVLENSKTTSSENIEQRAGHYRFINPLLECDFKENTELKPFKYEVEKYISSAKNLGKISNASVIFRDLDKGQWIGINENEDFSPASLLKVPLMISFLKQAETDPDLLKLKLKYDGSFDKDNMQNFPPSQTLEPGEEYTVEDLIYRMIVFSDNNAKELLHIYGQEAKFINQVYVDFGLEIPGVRNVEDFMSVREYSSFFRILYNASYLSRGMSNAALEILGKVEFKDGISKAIPKDNAFAHKFGERALQDGSKQLHDCGIVYFPKRPYLLCVMSRGNSFDNLKEFIRGVSRVVYREVDEQSRQ